MFRFVLNINSLPFRMVWSLIASVLVVVAMGGQAWASPLFSDVPAEHWAVPAVIELGGKGIVQGTSEGNLEGQRCITRFELIQILDKVWKRHTNALGEPADGVNADDLQNLCRELQPELEKLGWTQQRLEEVRTKMKR